MKTYSKLAFLAVIFIFSLTYVNAQEKYFVTFKDKNTEFNPFEYFDSKAIERRINQGISLYDKTDFPVNQNYIADCSVRVDSIKFASRWFNGIVVFATDNQIDELWTLPFVKSIEIIAPSKAILAGVDGFNLSDIQKVNLKRQIKHLEGDLFHENGIDGRGIRVAVFDAGYKSVDTNPAFSKIREENRILKTWDFVKKQEFVYSYNTHGTNVLSCVGGEIEDQAIGLATGAEFILARTEQHFEPFSEEENWLAAAEWADKNGADIINSSLGYTNPRYSVYDMDGQKSLVVKAANMAARKGILVVNSMGNSGSDGWKYLGTPADADSVLAIGGINPVTNMHISFSSFGPTIDKRTKPNLTAFGKVTASGPNGIHSTSGTSFSSPLVAGFAACALQSKPDLKTMELFEELQKSGNLFPYFDYAHGYGVPQASYFLNIEKEKTNTFLIEYEGDSIFIKILLKPDNTYNYLYFHIENEKSYLSEYKVINVEEDRIFIVSKSYLSENEILRIHYLGQTQEIKF